MMNQLINASWELCKAGDAINGLFGGNWSDWANMANFTETIKQNCDTVDIPHTWNNLDGQDGGDNYFRGTYWYTKDLPDIDFDASNEEVYLEFEGASSIAEVYVNGQSVTEHKGGFATFRANVTKYLQKKNNKIAVKVNNAVNNSVYPQKADFTFYGGIYRNVSLHVVNKVHFNLEHFGDSGIMITPNLELHKSTSDNCKPKHKGKLHVKCDIKNYNNEMIEILLKDDKEKLVLIEKYKSAEFTTSQINVHLWEGVKKPYLYTAEIRIIDNDFKILDSKTVKIGFRTMSIDPEDGFLLNGKPYPLRGVSRHQDRLDKGWAISKEDQDEDMALIRELGANAIRLAHYQHSQYFYDLCDKYGIIAWAEIPYITRALPEGNENAVEQMSELVYQNYNHPSIAVWGLSNEITVNGVTDDILETHKKLNDLVHSIDKTRLTTIADVTQLEGDSSLNKIPDVIAYNHYFGWYQKTYNDYGPWLDEFHEKYPKIALGLSEYGCEAITKYHSETPKQQDYTEEYQAIYHENVLAAIEERPYLWATFVWNMFDFGADNRDEGGVKGRNNKGLVTYDRKTKKDSFYMYKCHWSNEPTVHIASKRFVKRNADKITVKVYSNQKEIKLYANDKLIDTKTNSENYIYEFEVPLAEGETKIRAVSGSIEDNAVFEKVDKPCDDYKFVENIVINKWYGADGKELEMSYNRLYYSVLDTIGTIVASDVAGPVFKKIVQDMFDSWGTGRKVENIIQFATNVQPQMLFQYYQELKGEEMKYLNDELQKIIKN